MDATLDGVGVHLYSLVHRTKSRRDNLQKKSGRFVIETWSSQQATKPFVPRKPFQPKFTERIN